MRQPHSKPAIPATVLAAAMLLSITTATDVTVAAVLMNAGRQLPARVMSDGESLGQWLTRFADAARQMRDVFTGDESTTLVHAYAADLSCVNLPHCLAPVGSITKECTEPLHTTCLLPAMIDLPPPLR